MELVSNANKVICFQHVFFQHEGVKTAFSCDHGVCELGRIFLYKTEVQFYLNRLCGTYGLSVVNKEKQSGDRLKTTTLSYPYRYGYANCDKSRFSLLNLHFQLPSKRHMSNMTNRDFRYRYDICNTSM